MDEEVSSWIRRTKFSHTVFHRMHPSKVTSIPFNVEEERNAVMLKSQPSIDTATQKVSSYEAGPQRNRLTQKQRSLSPLPQKTLLDTSKKGRSLSKWFSTPLLPKKGHKKMILSHKTMNSRSPPSCSPLGNFASTKFSDKTMCRKKSVWEKYFDHGVGKVVAVETEEWAMDMSKLFLGLKFAHGAHSRLYHGIYMDEPVAVKIISVPEDDESGSLAARLGKQFTREATLLPHLHHPNVINFVAACKKPPVYCVVTEYLSEGSLRAYLHKLECKSIPSEKLIAISLDIARGMDYVHSQGVIHRDLKPENILIDENFHLKIADFGVACDASHCDILADDPGTYRWMAPEMIKRKCYGRKVDVYSFGLILWEMVAGRIPYEDLTPLQAAYAVLNKCLRPEIPKDCPPALKALIEQCWSLQPEKRPEFWQIIKVLEKFESSYAQNGTLSITEISAYSNQNKGLCRWIQKLAPVNLRTNVSPMPKRMSS